MSAVKKICRVSFVKREWLKPRKRSENGGSPLPTIPQHIVHTECALPLRKRVYGCRVPTLQIEIAKLFARCFVGGFIAPWVGSRIAVLRPVGGVLPLCLCW